jgi:site-specific DNA recombinase
MSAQWRTEQTRLLREIERHGSAEESYMEDGIRLLELARKASRLFAKQPAHEKNRLLNLGAVELQMGQRRSSRRF